MNFLLILFSPKVLWVTTLKPFQINGRRSINPHLQACWRTLKKTASLTRMFKEFWNNCMIRFWISFILFSSCLVRDLIKTRRICRVASRKFKTLSRIPCSTALRTDISKSSLRTTCHSHHILFKLKFYNNFDWFVRVKIKNVMKKCWQQNNDTKLILN